jgi:hypothetical protein
LQNNTFLQGNQAGLQIASSQSNIRNHPSILGTGNAVEHHTHLTPKEPQTSGASINAPRIPATETFGLNTSTQSISPSPLVKDQVYRKSAPGSDEQSPAVQRLIKAVILILFSAYIHFA